MPDTILLNIRYPTSNYVSPEVSNPEMRILLKIKEIKELRGGVLLYTAQEIPQIDTEIGQKGHLWMETNQ